MIVNVDYIESIETFPCNSKRYDITVRDNQNFVANDILVHNCQNLTKVLPNYYGKTFEITEKLHGSSQTVYFYDNEYGVCSRNLNLKESDTNTYWKVTREQKLFEFLEKITITTGKEYALQGELIGEGINGNMYNIKGHKFMLFDIFNITEQRYLTPTERHNFHTLFCRDGMHVPILNHMFTFEEFHTVEKLLQMVEHKSTLNGKVWAEGWVLKCNDVDFSFKVVSNKFLTSKQGEDA